MMSLRRRWAGWSLTVMAVVLATALGPVPVLLAQDQIIEPPRQELKPTQSQATAPARKVKTKVLPEYPELAKEHNTSGKVKIEVTISGAGTVKKTRVIGGSPLLVNAAVDALKKWRFEPGPRDTTEIIEFSFGDRVAVE